MMMMMEKEIAPGQRINLFIFALDLSVPPGTT